jgi:hypothetical protein
VILAVPGSAGQTKTPTDCCASNCVLTIDDHSDPALLAESVLRVFLKSRRRS